MHVRLLITSAALIGAAACGGSDSSTSPASGGNTGPTTGTPQNITVAVTPASLALTVGQTQPLSATVGGTNNTAVNWSTNASSIATVSATGVVTAVGAGNATITAAVAADTTKRATAVVTVTAPVASQLTLVVPGDTARPGTLLTMTVRGASVGTGPVTATLGGVALAFGVVDDSTLSAVTPDIGTGAQTLRVVAAGRTGQSTVTVRPGAVIANPLQTVNAQLDAAVSGFVLPEGTPASTGNQYRSTLDSLVRDAKAQFAAATPAEQLEAARLLASINASVSATSASSRASLGSQSLAFIRMSSACRSSIGVILRDNIGAIILAAASAAAIRFGPPQAKVAGFLGLVPAFAMMTYAIVKQQETFLKCFVFDGFDALLQPGLAPVSAFRTSARASAVATVSGAEFTQGSSVTVYPFANGHAFDRRDITDPDVAQFSAIVNRVASAVAALPSLFRQILPTPASPFDKRSTPTQRVAVPPADVVLASVTPSSIGLTAAASGTGIVLTARSTVTQDTPFTFDLAWREDPTLRSTNDGIFRTSVAGTYALETWSGKQVPTVFYDDPDARADLLSGSMTLTTGQTFSEVFNIKLTQKSDGKVTQDNLAVGGSYSVSGSNITFTIAGTDCPTCQLSGVLNGSLLTVTLRDTSDGAVEVSVYRRK